MIRAGHGRIICGDIVSLQTLSAPELRANIERALRETRANFDRQLGQILCDLMQLERLEGEHKRQTEPELYDGCHCEAP